MEMRDMESTELAIVKRNGEVVKFDPEKIRIAISKAVKATEKELASEIITKTVLDVLDEIRIRFVDFYPNVENVQDIVEKHLVNNDLYEVAKGYIIYRDQRRKEREKKSEETLEKAKLGKLRVIGEDGKVTLFDFSKIKRKVDLASIGFEEHINVNLITQEAVKNIYDGVNTEGIEKALILASIAHIEKDPAYSYVSGRLFLQKLYREVVGESMQNPNKDQLYRKSFSDGIKKGIDGNVFNKRLLEFDLERLSNSLKLERDELIQYMGLQTLHERYFAKVGEKRIELPQSFWMRISMGLAMNEENKNKKALEFYELLSSLRFISSSPTLFNSGTTFPQLSSCYLTTVMDDLAHIFKSYGDNAQLSKWSGGVANDWSNIRSTGDKIISNNIESQGLIPFLKIANDTTVAISRSGRKRGATVAYLETWHLDIEDFLNLRKNTGDERRRTHDMNTANWIPDLFMKRVLENKEWTLFSPRETPDLHHLYGRKFEEKYVEYEKKAKRGEIKMFKVVSATKLWRQMLSMLFETGHPWLTFKDPCNIRSPQDHVGIVHSSNLCTEITLNTSSEETAVCNLGSINLEKHIVNGQFDKDLIERTIGTAIRMLDNVIDLNFYPTVEGKNSNLKHRPIGLGIMGFQDALYKLDINFDSPEALDFADKSMEIISYHAILASSKLAKERGTYSSYAGSKWSKNIFPIDTIDILEKERGIKIDVERKESLVWASVREHVKEHGLRNSNIMAIAPTATIATISGCYPCIEPIYKNIYVKANISGEFTIVNHYLIRDLKKHGLWNDEMLDQLKYHDGNLKLIGSIPEKLKEKYKEVFDIDSKILIDMAALRGKWIDQSQSLNIFMKGVSGRKLSENYIYAWKKGLKTTYYLRSLAASQIEKSTLDSSKFGFTQKREYQIISPSTGKPTNGIEISIEKPIPATEVGNKDVCSILDPDCDACQ